MNLSWHNDSGFNIELTSHCGLKCTLCPRTVFRDQFQPTHLGLDFVKSIFTSELISAHECFRFIGNHGDPILHPDLTAVLEHFKLCNSRKLILNTSGSGRSLIWWRQIAAVLDRRDSVIFSIDGLRDTNGIYRINARWDDIAAGASAMAGTVRMGWKFIVFRHNQDQMDAAVVEARRMGFDWIAFEFSNRWSPAQLSNMELTLQKAQTLRPRDEFVTPDDVGVPERWPGSYQIMNRTVVSFE